MTNKLQASARLVLTQLEGASCSLAWSPIPDGRMDPTPEQPCPGEVLRAVGEDARFLAAAKEASQQLDQGIESLFLTIRGEALRGEQREGNANR